LTPSTTGQVGTKTSSGKPSSTRDAARASSGTVEHATVVDEPPFTREAHDAQKAGRMPMSAG